MTLPAFYDTISNLVNRVAPEVGLGTVSDLFGSTDQLFVQLRTLARSAGQDLLTDWEWEVLKKSYTQATAPSDVTGLYDLPSDWGYVVPETSWNTSSQYPLGGPLSSQDWMWLTVANIGSSIYMGFRFRNGQLEVYPIPPPTATLKFEYISCKWALAADGTTYKAYPTANDDKILFPDHLFVKKLKAVFLNSRGFDSTKADNEFEETLAKWIGNDNSAPILNASGRRLRVKLLGIENLPDTNYGH